MESRIKMTVHIATVLVLSVLTINAHASNDLVKRGEYVAKISGCHDCHTPGYAQNAGNVPKGQWLTGSVVGFAGPWGTSYPTNLRIMMSEMTEKQWLQRVDNMAKQPPLPPMPWFNLRDMNKKDLQAVYQYIRSLGTAGESAPTAAPPGIAVKTPFIDFVPKNLPTAMSAN